MGKISWEEYNTRMKDIAIMLMSAKDVLTKKQFEKEAHKLAKEARKTYKGFTGK